jgi:hypothetical protein
MGNGTGVSSHHQYLQNSKQYLHVEKLCKLGYFHQNHQEYLDAVSLAIQTNSLDCLELLIVSGNIKSLMPIHLAAKIGKLEPLEILVSAGFPVDTVDKEGRSPLHVTALSVSNEIGLVVSSLCISSPKSIKRYDYEGYTPIHFAVIHDNLPVIDALIKAGCDSNLASQTGKTPLQIAKEKRKANAEQFLQDLEQKRKKKSSEENKGTLSPYKAQHANVSTDRIMEVWERFFDNAFKNAGVSLEENDSDYNYYEDSKYRDYDDDFDLPPARTKSQSEKTKSKNKNQEPSKKLKSSSSVTKKEDWFEWIVMYDDSSMNYYVYNSRSCEKQWLVDYLEDLSDGKNHLFLFESSESIVNWPFPVNIWEVISYGWLTYYDSYENYCSWINLKTLIVEYYLPLATEEDATTLSAYNLFPSYDYPTWCEADQSCATAWVMVLYQDDYGGGGEESYYYLNAITGESCWTPPARWDLLLESWNGWIPCCMESNTAAVFWYVYL